MVMELNVTPTCPHALGTIFTDEGQKVAFFRCSIDELNNRIDEYVLKYEIENCYVSGAKSYAEGLLQNFPTTKFSKTLNFIYI